MQELADGGEPDQESYIQAYPELANALRGVFKTLDFVEATSKALNTSQLERGRLLGDYRIIREVARGGMGIVYEAVQIPLNRRVALKVLPTGALLSGNARERFTREAATAGCLHHTNIVPVYGVGEEQGIHFYAMQYIEGHSLSQHLKAMTQAGTTPRQDYFKRVIRWGQQIAGALEYAHGEGTIHRDIKPSNLLLDARDNVWVTDFGLARGDALATITLSGDIIGTARYMSPEQARGGRARLDGRTDVYSLGATLYELLALTPAFDGESREAVLNQIAFADPKPLRQVNGAIPRDLETIVAKCMEKEPTQRYARAADVAEDCRRFAVAEPIQARRTPTIVKTGRFLRRHRRYVLAATLVLVMAVTSAWMAIKVRRVQGRQSLQEGFNAIIFESNYERGARLLDEAESLGIDTPELHLYRGLGPLLETHPQGAFPHLFQALQRAPQHVEATLALAYAHTLSGDFFNGRRVFERVSGREITTALGWLLHGHVQSRIQRSAAIHSYDRAIALQPDFTPAISARATYRGYRLLIEGDRSELEPMLNDFDALVVFRPASSQSYGDRAGGWLFAAAYAVTQPDLRAHRAEWLCSCQKDIAHALAIRDGNDSRAFARQGVYLRYIEDYRGSVDALGKALAAGRASTGGMDPFLVHERVIGLHALGDLETALEEIEPICESAPTMYALALQRAILLAELGRLAEARAVCRETLDRQRGNATALFYTAAVTELLGDPEAAADAISEFAARGMRDSTSEDATGATSELALDYLSGHRSAESLLASAADDPGRRCEFAFMIALRELGQGHRAKGLATLRECIKTGVFIFGEYRYAQVMLARAAADPTWPYWIPRDSSPATLPVEP
ncbi:MAG: protein kinase [Planctomycetota bacterium]